MSTSGSKQAAGSTTGVDRRVVLIALGQGTFAPDAKAQADALRREGFAVISSELVALPERVQRLGPVAVVVEAELPHAPEVVERLRRLAPAPLVVPLGASARLRALGITVDPSVPEFSHPVDATMLAAFLREQAPGLAPRPTSSAPTTDVPSSRGSAPGAATGVGPAPASSHSASRSIGMGTASFGGDSEAILADFPAIAGLPEVQSILPELGAASASAMVGRLSPEIEALLEQCEQRVAKMDRGEALARRKDASNCLPDEVMAQLDDLLTPDEELAPATTDGSQLGALLAAMAAAGREPSRAEPAPDAPPDATPHDSLPPTMTHELASHSELPQPSGVLAEPLQAPLPHLPSEPAPRRHGSEIPRTTPGEDGTVIGPPQLTSGATPVPPATNDGGPRPSAADEPDWHSRPASVFDLASGDLLETPSRDSSPPTRAQLPPFSVLMHAPVHGSSAPPPAEVIATGPAPATTGPVRRTPLPAPITTTPLAGLVATERGDPIDLLARAIRARSTGALRLQTDGGVARQLVLREGDIVTAVSDLPEEGLCQFLVERGDLAPDVAQMRAARLPQTGRHAAAALIANGFLGQDDLWPILRAHAEWIITRTLGQGPASARLDPNPHEQLGAEPNVFGGATGAEVFVELVRRIVPTEQAIARLGGVGTRLSAGTAAGMLAESALHTDDLETVHSARDATVGQVLALRGPDVAPLLLALAALGVLEQTRPSRPADHRAPAETDPLDADAVRRRVAARLALVREGDYFALLGVAHDATAYDIRRAYLDLRRSFEPARLLTAATADLAAHVDLIAEVVEEAYAVLRDANRRARYRRAIEATSS